jgi:hypothetical protein
MGDQEKPVVVELYNIKFTQSSSNSAQYVVE